MRTTLMLLLALGLLLGCGGGKGTGDRGAAGDQSGSDTMATASTATADTAADDGLTWGPPPPGLPGGAQVAVISGDPGKAGPYTIRVDMPPDYSVRPHFHAASETVRVIEGTLHLGHGAKWDEGAMKAVAPDAPVTIAAKKPHFVHAASRVVLEIQSTGPFAITYLDSKDDPRNTSMR
jgi:hypothetical protein